MDLKTVMSSVDYDKEHDLTGIMTTLGQQCTTTFFLPYSFDIPIMLHIVCMPIIFILCVLGNSFVFYVLTKHKIYTTVSIFMRALAVLNLLFITFIMPQFPMIETYYIERHCGNPLKLNALFFFIIFEMTMYLLTFVAISCDRLYAVYMPFKYTNSRKRTYIVIAIIIGVSICPSSLVILDERSHTSMIARTITSVVIQISIGIIIVPYGFIFVKIRQQKRKIQASTNTNHIMASQYTANKQSEPQPSCSTANQNDPAQHSNKK